MPELETIWRPGRDSLLHLWVYCIGKWRPSYPACRRPRPLNPREIAEVRHQVWLNTGRVWAESAILIQENPEVVA